MNKILLHTILAAVSLLIVSCQINELSRSDFQKSEVIDFSAYTTTVTGKGTIVEKTDVQTQGIGVFAFYQPAVSGQPVPFSTRKFVTPDFMYNQQVSYNGTDWTYAPVKCWPNNENDCLSFFAYAPYKENRRWDSMGISTNSNADKLNVTFEVNEDLASQEDILWATPQINQSNKMENRVNNTSRRVSFNFKHVTSKLDLMIGVSTGSTADAWNDANTGIVVKSIAFSNLNSEFKYVYNIIDSKLAEPATVDYCDGKTYTLNLETDENKSTISEDNWGIPAAPLHPHGIFTSEYVAKYGYYYPCLQDNQHLFLAPQVFTDQTVTVTYVVKTTDPNNNQNSSTITNSVTKNLASIFPYIGSSTTDRGLESGKSYNIKFLIGLDDVNIVADVQSWDTDIFDHEVYVPSNYTVTMWQNGICNPASIVADQDLCINVRDIALDSTNSGFYRIKDYSVTPYALNELTEQVLADEIAKSRLTPSESDMIFTKVDDVNIEYLLTKSTVFETSTMCVKAAGLVDNGVYVFEYSDQSGLKSYQLVKVGVDPATTPALTMAVDSGLREEDGSGYFIYFDFDRQFTIAVTDNGSPVSQLVQSNFVVEKVENAQLVEDAFTIEETATAGTYQFTTENVEIDKEYVIRLSADSIKIEVSSFEIIECEAIGFTIDDSGDYTPLWTAGDKIMLYDGVSRTRSLTLAASGSLSSSCGIISETDASKFSFIKPKIWDNLYAVHPYCACVENFDVSDPKINFVAQDGTFANANISAAVLVSSKMSFKNLGAILKFPSKPEDVRNIIIPVQELANDYKLGFTGATPFLTSLETTNSNEFTIGEGTGVTYIGVPAGNIAEGSAFIFEFSSKVVAGFYMTDSAISVTANNIYTLPDISLSGMPQNGGTVILPLIGEEL